MSVTPPPVRPRADWAAGLAPVGRLQPEEDVRFLLVHHTASPNADPGASVEALRGFFSYHTTAKGWPDIAYNFLIDSGGQIWEGRQGSLAGPVRGDATGGSQGHAILCCFIGDFATVEPAPAAVQSMTHLLAWQADLHGLDLADGAEVTFTSRGSNRWPPGSSVTTPPVAGHRDMSLTTCPGDAAYSLIGTVLWPGARALVEATSSTPPAKATPGASSPVPATTPSASSASPAASEQAAHPIDPPPGESGPGWPMTLTGAAGLAALTGLGWVLRRRLSMQASTDSEPRGRA